MKHLSKLICIIIICAIIAIPADALTEASHFFSMESAYLTRTSGTTFAISYDVTATGMMDELGADLVHVERSSDDSNWSTVYTFYDSDRNYMIADNTCDHACELYYTGISGYYYRAYVDFYAHDDGNYGYDGRYTASIYIP